MVSLAAIAVGVTVLAPANPARAAAPGMAAFGRPVVALATTTATRALKPLPGGRLSDERTQSRWAHTVHTAAVRVRPDPGARRIVSLRRLTEDGLPEVYLLLRRHIDRKGAVWIRIRIPGRPNGRTGWVRRSALGDFNVVTTQLTVDRRRLRATLRRGGRVVWSAPVGVGTPGTPTPAGRFWAREMFRVVPAGTLYGPYAFGTSDYSVLSEWPGGGVIGIHGTDEPGILPGRVSHGCIRMRNRDITWLAHHMPVGTPILVV